MDKKKKKIVKSPKHKGSKEDPDAEHNRFVYKSISEKAL